MGCVGNGKKEVFLFFLGEDVCFFVFWERLFFGGRSYGSGSFGLVRVFTSKVLGRFFFKVFKVLFWSLMDFRMVLKTIKVSRLLSYFLPVGFLAL